MATRIVVIGGSFGGITTALEIKRLLRNKVNITLLCDLDRFIFIPSLPWLAFGYRKAEDITIPLKKILSPRGISFVHVSATGVDPDSSKVITEAEEYEYDFLVIATGADLVFNSVPGLGPYEGFTECIFTLDQAERAYKAWLEFLQEPGPVVIGAVQGVSCFGPAYEYAFEMDHELKKRRIRHKVPITFITSEPYVGHFGIGGLGLSRRIIEDEFAERDIRFITNAVIEEITRGNVKLKSGEKLPFKFAMFAPPMAGVKAVAELGNPKGFIPVDEQYRHKNYDNIYSVGVAVAIAPPEPTPVPTGVPKTGYMTVRMAKTAARAITSNITGRAIPEAEPLDVICLMDMGDKGAIMKADPVLPPRESSLLKAGKPYRWLKVVFEKYYMKKIRFGLSQLP